MSEAASVTCRCPHCRSLIEVPAGSLGQECLCPKCLARFCATAWVAPEPVWQGAPGSMPSGRYGPAFEHHRQLGFFPALWQTIKDVLAEPTQTFAALHLNNGYSLPFLYATLIALVAGIANQIWGMLLQGALIALTGAAGNVPISGMDLFGVFGGGVLGFLCAIPQAPFSAASAMFINGGIAHLMLMIFKANRYPFEATARAMAYAGTPAILCLIPVIGLLAAPIWGVVTAIIALREVHETTTGIAVAAILLPAGMALCCCCCLFALVPFLAS